jgi:hypothetical protein
LPCCPWWYPVGNPRLAYGNGDLAPFAPSTGEQ